MYMQRLRHEHGRIINTEVIAMTTNASTCHHALDEQMLLAVFSAQTMTTRWSPAVQPLQARESQAVVLEFECGCVLSYEPLGTAAALHAQTPTATRVAIVHHYISIYH